MKNRPTYFSPSDDFLLFVLALMVTGGFVSMAITIKKAVYIISAIVFAVLFAITLFSLIKHSINRKRMAKQLQLLTVYLDENHYSQLYGSRISDNINLEFNEKNKRYFLIYDPDAKMIPFSKVKSRFPERFDFYFSVADIRYLCVFDGFMNDYYIFKKTLPQ